MSGNIDRDESGKFDSELGDEDLIRYFADGRPFHTAGEVADTFGIDRSTAYRRLSRLAEDGQLEKVSLGSRTVVWWYTRDTVSPEGFDSADSLFTAPAFSVSDPVDEDDIDDILYGEIEG